MNSPYYIYRDFGFIKTYTEKISGFFINNFLSFSVFVCNSRDTE